MNPSALLVRYTSPAGRVLCAVIVVAALATAPLGSPLTSLAAVVVTLLALAADSGNWISANFKETQIGRMRLGDPVDIRVDAFPDRMWRGHVESMSPATGAKYALLPPDNATGNFTKVVQRVPVRIALEPEPSRETPDVAAARDLPWSGDSLPVGLSVNVSVRVR